MTSLAQRLAALPPEERDAELDALSEAEAAALERDWLFWARDEQVLPFGDWLACWISGGRGSGKTRSGAEALAIWVREYPDVDWGIVAPTFRADALRKCVEGESGVLRALGGENGDLVANYNRSEGVVYLKTGGSIFATGADNGALRIQGENLAGCWVDEPGLFKRTTWELAWNESIQFAVRKQPAKIIVTGTPKAGHPLVKLLNGDDNVPKVRMRTADNIANLDPEWVDRMLAKYTGTRLGAQELEGQVIEEVEGALWTWATIERTRWKDKWGEPRLLRVIVGVDPSGGANEIGIVAAGRIVSPCPCGGEEAYAPHFAVLDDKSLLASPAHWGRAATDLYHDVKADRIVGERNFGGEMVEHTVQVADPSVPYRDVNASRGKSQRAEPISALAEQNRIHHQEAFVDLENELTSWVPGDDWSPNRLDAYVWALAELQESGGPAESTLPQTRIREW